MVTRDEKASAVSTTVVAVPQPAYINAVPTLPYVTEEHAASTTATVSDDKTESASVEEKGGPIWEGYREDDIPEKTHGHFLRNVRFQIFSLYRRLFGIVFVTNMAIFIAACVRGGTNTDANHLGLITIANLFVAILMRQAYVINAFFTVAMWTPRSCVVLFFSARDEKGRFGLTICLRWPLWTRRIIGRVYSIGGSESQTFLIPECTGKLTNTRGSPLGSSGQRHRTACPLCRQGNSAVHPQGQGMLKTPFSSADTRSRAVKITVPTITFTYIILALLLSMIVFAYPRTRQRHHDTFEMVHRFSGWTAVALVWCLVSSNDLAHNSV